MDMFYEKVKEMRAAQKAFFRARKQKDLALSNYWLSVSLGLEKEVDRLIAEREQPGLF